MAKTIPDNHKLYNAFDLIEFAWSKKWILIILPFLAGVAAFFVSSQMPEKFLSSVILFPAADISISKNLVETSSITMDSRDVLSFGDEEEAERLLQILSSAQIRDFIIDKYDLINHYEIDMESKYPYTSLNNKFKANIKSRRTKYMSIEISVLDTEPQTAADIANDIASYIDSTIHRMQQDRALESFYIVEREYKSAQKEISMLNGQIQKIRKLGIVDYESQAAALSEALATSLAKGNQSAARSIERRMEVLSTHGGDYISLSKELESEIERLGQLKAKYAAAKVNVEQQVPQIFIVDRAEKAEKKAEPKRFNITIITAFTTFILTLLLLLILDIYKTRS